jgi:hypothetical protein
MGLALIWLATSLPFVFLYLTCQRVVIEEVRHHVMGVAIAAASGLNAADLHEIRSTNDMAKPVFRQTQVLLDRIAGGSADIRYVYTMRRSERPFTPVTAYEYIVDQAASDENHDGVLDRDELSELPGTPYDASGFPEMISAWNEPTADKHITPDPPYPDVISGYAPIRDSNGVTRAIVGVDITAATVHRKLLALQIVVGVVWLVLSLLITLVVSLYYQQRDAFDRIKRLNEELESRNEMLRVANLDLARSAKPHEAVVLREPAVVFDKSGVRCAVHGSELYDVIELDEDHIALFLAHVAGSDVGAALVSGLLKMAVASVRERSDVTGTLYVDLGAPHRVLRTLNDMLAREMPKGESAAFIYAVVDLMEHTIRFASAGQPGPIRYSAKAGRYEPWSIVPGPALGLLTDQSYEVVEKAFAEGDQIVFFTESLPAQKNARGDAFGREAMLSTIDRCGHIPPERFLAELADAVEAFTGASAARDRFGALAIVLK